MENLNLDKLVDLPKLMLKHLNPDRVYPKFVPTKAKLSRYEPQWINSYNIYEGL